MRAGRPGFALMLVLLGVAGVFALAVQSAVAVRTATVEARVVRERTLDEQRARSAASLVLVGLLTPPEEAPLAAEDGTPIVAGATLASAGSSSSAEPERPKVELPPMLLEMLGKKAEELERGAQQAADQQRLAEMADGGGVTGRVPGGSSLRIMQRLAPGFRPIKIEVAGHEYTVTVVDAGGLLNINQAEEQELLAYFGAIGLDPLRAAALADELLDWRDEDGITRERGAEREAYRVRGVEARNGDIRALEELLFLPSMTREIFERTRGHLCLGGDGKIHAGSAPREVLQSIPGMKPDVVDRIIEARAAGALDDEALDRAVPLGLSGVRERLRAKPMSLLGVRVERVGGAVFEGFAIVGDRGLEQLGLRAL